MATPLKPWERSVSGAAPSASSQPPQFSLSSRVPGSSSTSTSAATSSSVSTVPSIPPRSSTSGYLSSQHYAPGFGAYGGGYSSYGGGYGGGYGYGRPYGGIGGAYGGGYGNVESPFLQQAEESTRSAFQSVESVVGAVSSISAMLESTYFAVHSCFRAVLGVAQHFTRLRNYVWGIISAVALLHRLRYWLKKILRLLRLRRNMEQEDVWEESNLERAERLSSTLSSPENRVWPAVLFFVIVFGVPWLLWRLLSALSSLGPESSTDSWSEETDQPPTVARALYDFTPQREDEMGFSAGDEMVLAPRQLQTGWALAGKDRKSGLVPMNYIQVLQPTRRPASGSGTPPTSATPPNNAPPSPPGQQLHDQETLLND